jgi:farnesyl diphosphate synthase
MDDAALRRGRAACHKAFDEATAILAGDALQALAFEILAEDGWGPDAAQRCALATGLARAAGALGMCGGQMIDLLAPGRELSFEQTRELQALKTGTIIAFSAEAGAVLGRAGRQERDALRGYGELLGLAFQVRDDLLDHAGDSAAIGKDAGRDDAAGKATFLRFVGPDGAERLLDELRGLAFAHLDIFGDQATVLRLLFEFAIRRTS